MKLKAMPMWSVVDAKSQLSEVLRRARAGQPQTIGAQNPCVVISWEDYIANFANHDGEWILRQTVGLEAELTLPSRSTDRDAQDFEFAE
jgi:prevent-host-death family protein